MPRIIVYSTILAIALAGSGSHGRSGAGLLALSYQASPQGGAAQRAGDEWLRVWSSGEADIAARADGFVAVERAIEQVILPDLHDLTTPYDVFTPDQITQWTDTMRAFIRQPRNDTTTYLRPSLSNVSSLSLSVSYYHRRDGIQWGTLVSTPCGSGTWRNRTLAQLHDLLDKLDSAAALARRTRNPPAALDRNIVRDRADVTCPARVHLRLTDLPVDSARIRNPYQQQAPIEVLTRVVVSAGAVADTASLEFYPQITVAQRQAIAAVLPRWRWWTATLHGSSDPATSGVGNRAHVVVRFVNPADSADIVQFGIVGRMPQFVALDNGMVAWSSRFRANMHELYFPGDVLRWAQEIRAAPQVRRASDLHFSRATQCGGSEWQVYSGSASAGAWLDSAEAAARRAIAKNATPIVDTSRIYGELEITCAAARRGGRSRAIVEDDSIRAALSLRSEALAGFVVDSGGNVNRESIYVFGEWGAADRQRITTAVASLKFLPALHAGLRVSQRSHYLIHPTARNGPGSRDPVRSVCVAGEAAGIRVTVADGTVSARRSDLERIADAVLDGRREPAARLTEGAFRVTIVPDGSYSAPQWTRAARDTALSTRLPQKFPDRMGVINAITVDVEVGVRCS